MPNMTSDDAKWLHIRLQIIEEQAHAIRDLANKTGDARLFPIVENIRSVVINSCRKVDLTK